jgi:hypothetical protein
MNSKRKGSRNEHRSIRIPEAAGYAVTPGSAEKAGREGNLREVTRDG